MLVASSNFSGVIPLASMSYQDWVFSIHLLFAATLVGGLFMSWIIVVALMKVDSPDLTLGFSTVEIIGAIAILLGLAGTITLGIWLAILRVQFHPWDGWIIGAYVLWAIATVTVLFSFREYRKPRVKAQELIDSGAAGANAELKALNQTATGLLLRLVTSVAVVLIVIDMIYKPGAS